MNIETQLNALDSIYEMYNRLFLNQDITRNSLNIKYTEFIFDFIENLANEQYTIKFPIIDDVLSINVSLIYRITLQKDNVNIFDISLSPDMQSFYRHSLEELKKLSYIDGDKVIFKLNKSYLINEHQDHNLLFNRVFKIRSYDALLNDDRVYDYATDDIIESEARLEFVLNVLNHITSKLLSLYLILPEQESVTNITSKIEKLKRLQQNAIKRAENKSNISLNEFAESIPEGSEYEKDLEKVNFESKDVQDIQKPTQYDFLNFESNIAKFLYNIGHSDIYDKPQTFYSIIETCKRMPDVKKIMQFFRLCNLVKKLKSYSNNLTEVNVYKLYKTGEIEIYDDMTEIVDNLLNGKHIDHYTCSKILDAYDTDEYVIGIPYNIAKNIKDKRKQQNGLDI